MQCPNCGGENFRTIDSRRAKAHIRRRRECETCGTRFTTKEVVAGEKEIVRVLSPSQDALLDAVMRTAIARESQGE